MAGFQNIIGYEQIIEIMKYEIQCGKISHAYMLSGEKGMGKRMLADAFAMTLLCEEGRTNPCMHCHSCKQFLSGNHPDVVYVTHEKPNSIGIDEIRYQLNEDIQVKPYSSPYKIYIIEDAELMTEQAQNALLKTIEEPPAYGVIMILTTNKNAMLQTILSRCVKFSLQPLSDAQIKDYLEKQYGIQGKKADLYSAFARGNLGKAISLAESEDFQLFYDEVLHLLRHIPDMNVSELLDYIKKLTSENVDLNQVLDFIQLWYRDVLMFKVTNDVNLLIFKDEKTTIRDTVAKSSYEGIEEILKAVERARTRLKANVNVELTMELLWLVMKEN